MNCTNSGGAPPPLDDARIHDRAGPADGVEEHLVPVDLDGDEHAVPVVPRGHEARARVDVAEGELAPGAGHEVRDPTLRLRPLVDMVVPGEGHGDVVLEEDWFEQFTQAEPRA